MSWDKDRRYREKLDYEQQIMRQLQECMDAFNLGDRKYIIQSVNAWELLVTPDIIDAIYTNELSKLNDEWEIEYEKLREEYKIQCAKAQCPDVIPKPSFEPHTSKFKLKFQIILALFQRSDLLLQREDNESIS